MAKGNLFMGMARGKVGSVVFSRLAGQQVSRAYNSQVSNPKTVAQQLQRACFATATRASKFMSAIVDHSFFGVKDGAECLRKFVQLNAPYLAKEVRNANNVLNLNFKGSNVLSPAPYIISQGNLTELVPLTFSRTMQGTQVASVCPIGGVTIEDRKASVADFMSLLNLQAGDQLSFVGIIGKIADGEMPTETRLITRRIVFSQAAPTLTDKGTWDFDIFLQGAIEASLSQIDGVNTATFNNKGYICFNTPEGYDMFAGAWILSRYNSSKGEWDYSPQTMLVWEDMGDDNENAIASYGNVTKSTTSDYYLDQASSDVSDTGTVASTAPQVVFSVYDEGGTKLRQSSYLMSDAVGGRLGTTAPPQGRVEIDLYPTGNYRISHASLTNSSTSEKVAKNLNYQNHIQWSIEAGNVGTSLNFDLKATQGETRGASIYVNEVDYVCEVHISVEEEG